MVSLTSPVDDYDCHAPVGITIHSVMGVSDLLPCDLTTVAMGLSGHVADQNSRGHTRALPANRMATSARVRESLRP